MSDAGVPDVLLSNEREPLPPVIIGRKTPKRGESHSLFEEMQADEIFEQHVYNKTQLIGAVGACDHGGFYHIMLHRADEKTTHYFFDYRQGRISPREVDYRLSVFKKRIRVTPAEAFK
jgi:hypothetical protein